MYGILAQSLGIKVVRARQDQQWQIDLDYAQALFLQESVAIVFVVSPNSPTGNILTRAEVARSLAAHRVGYCIGDPQLKVRLPYNLPTISARTAHLAMVHRGELLGTIPETIAVWEEFYEFVQNLGWRVWRSWANLCIVKLMQMQRFSQNCQGWVF